MYCFTRKTRTRIRGSVPDLFDFDGYLKKNGCRFVLSFNYYNFGMLAYFRLILYKCATKLVFISATFLLHCSCCSLPIYFSIIFSFLLYWLVITGRLIRMSSENIHVISGIAGLMMFTRPHRHSLIGMMMSHRQKKNRSLRRKSRGEPLTSIQSDFCSLPHWQYDYVMEGWTPRLGLA